MPCWQERSLDPPDIGSSNYEITEDRISLQFSNILEETRIIHIIALMSPSKLLPHDFTMKTLKTYLQ